MKHESYLARFVKSHRSGLILTTLVIEMLVSPAADYHPHIGAVLAAFIWLVIVAAANYMASRELMCWVVLPLAGVWALARLLEAFASPDHPYSHLATLAGLALSCSIL